MRNSEVVGPSRLDDLFVSFGAGPDLIEEELIGLVEVRAEALVELVDQRGQGNLLVRRPAVPTSVGPFSGSASPSDKAIEPSLICCRRKYRSATSSSSAKACPSPGGGSFASKLRTKA